MTAIRRVVKQAISQGLKDQVPRMSAALAFYTVFSLAPILIVVIALAGLAFGQKAALDQLMDQIRQLIGPQSAEAVQAMIEASVKPSSSFIATVIGVLTLLVGATSALVELQQGLNYVWKVKSTSSWLYLLKQRLSSLAQVAGIGFLLLVSLTISAALSAVGTLMGRHILAHTILLHGMDFILSCIVITVFFAMIFKILPEEIIAWNDVWIGAVVTALLFTIGKIIVGLYIGKGVLTSSYGAAGSFVAVLTWVYYSSLTLYFGAEFTKAYADQYGSRRNTTHSIVD